MSNYGNRIRFGRLVWTILVVFYFIVFFSNFLADALPTGRLLANLFAVLFVVWLGIEYYFGAPFFQSGIVEHSSFWRGVFAFFVYPFIGYCAADLIWWHWTQLPLPAPFAGVLGLLVFGVGTLVRLEVLFGLLGIIQVKVQGKEERVTIPEKKLVGLRLLRLTRHPRDLGTIVQLLGIALVFNSWGGVVLALALGLPLILAQVRHDDRLMRELLKAEADRYYAAVPLLFPRLGRR
jgi:protein-S-isoprenylcysteine O-methyltransferase Ste14